MAISLLVIRDNSDFLQCDQNSAIGGTRGIFGLLWGYIRSNQSTDRQVERTVANGCIWPVEEVPIFNISERQS